MRFPCRSPNAWRSALLRLDGRLGWLSTFVSVSARVRRRIPHAKVSELVPPLGDTLHAACASLVGLSVADTWDRNDRGGYGWNMPDIINIIEADHREVHRLFAAYSAATSEDNKDKIVDQIRLALAPHAAAEEILVYPAVRRAAEEGPDKADHSIDEHQEIKRLLSEVDKMAAGDPQRDGKLRELQDAVEHHVQEEEGSVLPTLRAGADAQRLEQMGDLFEKIKPLLPTHPHPLVPGTSTAQLLAGPLASVADRIRDFVAR